MNEKNGAIRDASVLGVPKMLILGLQHMFAMFGATILVPILVNSYFEGEGCTSRSGYFDLRRCGNIILPSVFQIQGSCISRFILRLLRRICNYRKS